MVVFGPIPSRRLGRSLGINNIPPKSCSYFCTYCQVGPTQQTEIERRHFYGSDYLVQLVKEHVAKILEQGDTIDYLSFVPDGEPTLDADLSQTIDELRPLGIKIAIITNGSLIWHPLVQETLKKADWVSLKVDTVDEETWSHINLPHPDLKLAMILEGMLTFAKAFTGTLVTETMLVKGVNLTESAAKGLADFLHRLNPTKAYFLVPTRPPAMPSVRIPTQEELNFFYQIISSQLSQIEYLTNYEGNTFGSTGNAVEDLLNITAVHPMRESAVRELLAKNKANWEIVETLLHQGQLTEMEYEGYKFYVRRF